MGIGPSTKETTLHHFRDPLVEIVSNDGDIDLLGIIVAGTPQANEEKVFTGQRIGAWAEAMRVDGAIVSIDGWGNISPTATATASQTATPMDHLPVKSLNRANSSNHR